MGCNQTSIPKPQQRLSWTAVVVWPWMSKFNLLCYVDKFTYPYTELSSNMGIRLFPAFICDKPCFPEPQIDNPGLPMVTKGGWLKDIP